MKRFLFICCFFICLLIGPSLWAADHFVETFDSFPSAYMTGDVGLPSGTWNVTQVYGESASASRGGSGRAARINDNIANAHLTTPPLLTVGTVSFYYRELNSGGGTFKLQKSVGGGAFTDVASHAYSGLVYQFYTLNVNEEAADVRIRILSNSNNGHLIIDDMTVTDFIVSTNSPPFLSINPPETNIVVEEGTDISFSVTAQELDGDTFTLTSSNLPAGAVFTPDPNTGTNQVSSTFSWVSVVTGLYSVVFSAGDPDGTNSLTVGIEVQGIDPHRLLKEGFDEGEDMPIGWLNGGTITDTSHYQSAPLSRGLGTASSLTTPAVDYPTNLSFYVDASNNGHGQTAEVWVRVGTNEWELLDTFIVSTAGGTESISLVDLTDISWSPDVQFQFVSSFATWYLDDVLIFGSPPPPQAPVLAPIGDQIAAVSNTLELVISATDRDGDMIELWAENLPPGAVFAGVSNAGSVTGTFTFTPSAAQADVVYSVTFNAGDVNGTNQETLTLSVYDKLISFVDSGQIMEEGAGTNLLPVILSRSCDATVQVAVAGTAIQGEDLDYTLSQTSCVFVAGGSTTQLITLTVFEDVIPEADKTIQLTLLPPAGVEALPFPEHTVTLVDDDVIYSEPLDVDPGWLTSWQWAFGVPAGLGGDPASGHTGNNVYGYNLAGSYYSPLVTPYYLTTPAIDCSGYRDVTLSFWRWLGVEESPYDEASIQVSNDGQLWRDVWLHNGPHVVDTAWTQMVVDLSFVAEDQETVYIRWGMGSADAYLSYCGWNIDDIVIDGVAITDPILKFAHDQAAVHETNGTVLIPVLLSEPVDQEVTVFYFTSSWGLDSAWGTATADADYTTTTGTLIFAVGVVSNSVEIPISTDTLIEGNETFFLRLGSHSNAKLGALSVTMITITDSLAPQAAFPFSDGFESGTFATYWTSEPTQAGRTQVDSVNTPVYEGAYHVCMDSSQNATYGLNELTLTIDLSGQDNVYLDFWERTLEGYLAPMPEHFLGRVKSDGVAISEDGINWYSLYEISAYPTYYWETDYQHRIYNLSEIAESYGLTPGPHFQIKFQQYHLYAFPTSGRCLDTVRLYDGDSAADLSVSMSDAPDPSTVGSNLTYAIWVSNAGPSTASNVILTNPIPAGSAFISATSTVGTCTYSNSILFCELGNMLPETMIEVTLVLSPTEYQSLTNRAGVTGSSFDYLLSNNEAEESTLVDMPGGDLQFNATGYAVREGQSSLLVTVTRTNRTYGEITVDFATADGTAAAGEDYVSTTGTLVLPSGVLSTVFWVNLIEDDIPEDTETIQLSIDNPTGGAVLSSPSVATLSINDNDGVAVFPLSETFESNGLTNYWSTYSTGNGRIAITSDYDPHEGSQHLGMDSLYASALNELILTIDLAGQEGVTLSFWQKEFWDEDHTMPDSFTNHFNADGVAMSMDGTQWFKIQGLTGLEGSGNEYQLFEVSLDPLLAANGWTYNDHFKIKFQQYDNVSFTSDGFVFDEIQLFSEKGAFRFTAPAYDGGEFSGAFTVEVERVNGTLGDVSVDYTTSNGTATAGADYTSTSGTLTFASGEFNGVIVIPLHDDSEDEPEETLHLFLSNPMGGAQLSSPIQALLTLHDDDGPGEFTFSSETYITSESNDVASIPIWRLGGAEGEAGVNYAVMDGTASNGFDYVSATGTLTFADGVTSQVFSVSLLDDSDLEALETIQLGLENPVGGATIGMPSQALLSIADDEDPHFEYWFPAYGLTGLELKQALHDIIDDHIIVDYTPGLWNLLQETDVNPDNSLEVLLFYSQIGRNKYNAGGDLGQWNREHVWPRSHGFPGDPSSSVPPSVDAHNIKPTDVAINTIRDNKDFDAGGTAVPSTPSSCLTTATTFEPPDVSKGDVARILFYMDVRYAGDQDNEVDLELVDSADTAGIQMGKLSTLIQWHLQDPPDAFEERRNNLIYTNWQGNRNPFIDHPEWALEIWEYRLAIATLAGEGGHITPENPQVLYASDELFEIQPDPYWTIADVWTNGVPLGADYGTSSYSFVWSPVVATGQVEAVFAAKLATNDTPEWWLASHGFTSNFNAAALADQDEDGFPTWKEYLLGSIPTNPASLLQFEVVDSASVENGLIIRWQSESNRTYTLWKGSNLLVDFTNRLATNLPAQPPMNVYTDSVDGLRLQFYRIDLEP